VWALGVSAYWRKKNVVNVSGPTTFFIAHGRHTKRVKKSVEILRLIPHADPPTRRHADTPTRFPGYPLSAMTFNSGRHFDCIIRRHGGRVRAFLPWRKSRHASLNVSENAFAVRVSRDKSNGKEFS
jgi:hypothetical protein